LQCKDGLFAQSPDIKLKCKAQPGDRKLGETVWPLNCADPSKTTFAPKTKAQLKAAVVACIKLSAKGDCAKGSYGPIESWDVSGVTDMGNLFSGMSAFNRDLSKWDTSSVTNMQGMFHGASSFIATCRSGTHPA